MSAPRSASRRRFLAESGALVVCFSMSSAAASTHEAPKVAPGLPGSLEKFPLLDSWIRIGADNSVTVFTGKVELGQGILCALRQVAAEQLSVPFDRVTMVSGDTERTPNEDYTNGSKSTRDSGGAILNAAAQVRELLIERAAGQLGVPAERLTALDGEVRAPDGRRIRYGDLVAGAVLRVQAQPRSKLKDPATHTLVGKSIGRPDIPPKVTGGAAFVQDLRFPGMLHARVLHPPGPDARLRSLDANALGGASGVVKVIRDGRFIAVAAQDEYQAVVAVRALGDAARWDEPDSFPPQSGIYDHLLRLPSEDSVIHGEGAGPLSGARVFEATFRRPYQMHGAIGPSCAVAWLRGGKLTIWTHSQGVFPLRDAIAVMLRMPPENVHCIHMEGAGCYGHNGADDAAADAARIARDVPGRPVRVQWMREDEHAWEPYGPAMVVKAQATLAGGRISGWRYDVWSNAHINRPSKGQVGNLSTALLLAAPFPKPDRKPVPLPDGGGHRNAIPLYRFPNARVVYHFIPQTPLRVSALRALGAYTNGFAMESLMEELALAANVDPVEFRLRHLDDPRAREVIRMTAERFGWPGFQRRRNHGRGFAFAHYKNYAGYCAVAMEVEVDPETGAVRVGRVVSAVDCGTAISPDGIRNQVEGGILHSLSWTLHEAVAWSAARITSRDWGRYPILRFREAPASVEVHVIDRPGEPFLGTGEISQGPTAGALANAIADAIGVRIRDLPLDRARVRAAAAARANRSMA